MTRLLCVIVLVACGPKPGAPAHPEGKPRPSDPRPPQGDQTSGPTSARLDCSRLVDHVVTLAVAERPADQKPTDDERKHITADLNTSWSPRCEQMTSKGYDCALAAQSLGELERCGG